MIQLVANRVIDIAKQARAYNVENVFIASIMKRRGDRFRCIIDDINLLLRIACLQNNFYFIDNNIFSRILI